MLFNFWFIHSFIICDQYLENKTDKLMVVDKLSRNNLAMKGFFNKWMWFNS